MSHPRTMLRGIYDRAVERRERTPAPSWETPPRDAFAALLKADGAHTVLELGAATGRDGLYFREQGFDVLCTDLSPAMVERCRQAGLEAEVADVGDLPFAAERFDAVYAKNCLIHVPRTEIMETVAGIARVMKPGGLVYVSVYGGKEFEGIWDGDSWEEKRFFSFRTDAQLRAALGGSFEIHSFDVIPEGFGGQRYQSVIARRPRG